MPQFELPLDTPWRAVWLLALLVAIGLRAVRMMKTFLPADSKHKLEFWRLILSNRHTSKTTTPPPMRAHSTNRTGQRDLDRRPVRELSNHSPGMCRFPGLEPRGLAMVPSCPAMGLARQLVQAFKGHSRPVPARVRRPELMSLDLPDFRLGFLRIRKLPAVEIGHLPCSGNGTDVESECQISAPSCLVVQCR